MSCLPLTQMGGGSSTPNLATLKKVNIPIKGVSTLVLFLNPNFLFVHHFKHECVNLHYLHKSFTLGKLFQYKLLN